MSTSKMTMEAFRLAEAAYKKTLKQMSSLSPLSGKLLNLKLILAMLKKDNLEIRNGFDQLTVDEPNDGDEQTTPLNPNLPPYQFVEKLRKLKTVVVADISNN
ncbi:hypothetical protein CEXT_513631 [Caerostris extrusa]|uniref:Uncharacterized protein n=1 Tax=Caerostris extrusa TaxID=172846 RepID=A0AAV4VAY5_CAEEX|nr:hypothetical protein CEXT_513631 [Caerostris extrusa]